MKYKRKEFLRLGAAATAAITLGSLGCKLMPKKDEEKQNNISPGIQLYTVRDELAREPKQVLKQLSSFGYKYIESFEREMGIWWGMSNIEFKKYMDDLGMVIVASHCDINNDFENKAGLAAEIGMKYLLSSSFGKMNNPEEYKRLTDRFNQCGEICRKAGIRFGFHGEDSDFRSENGFVAHDYFMKNTDPALVDFELDIYWATLGGQDPVALLKNHGKRFRMAHIKDRIKGSSERDASCDLGNGSIDIKRFITAATEIDMEYFFIEQERYDGTSPLKSAADNAKYITSI